VPRLDSQFPPEYHEPNCPNHRVYRLYIRGYNKRGKQVTIPWGLACENCKAVIRQPYKRNLTEKQRDKQISMPKLPFRILNEETTITNQKLSKEEIEIMRRKRIKEMKIRRRKQPELVDPQISRREKIHTRNIKSMNKMYKDDCICYPVLKKMINWDPKLVERFLAIRPTFEEMTEVLSWYPLCRVDVRRANKVRGMIDDPEKYGFLKRDLSHNYYIPHPKKPHTWKHNLDPNKIGEHEKLIIGEADGRMALMEVIIRKHLESKIKVHYIVQDEKQTVLKRFH